MTTIKQWLAVLTMVCVAAATTSTAFAAKTQPSPFAGVWCGYGFPVTISDSGRVTGKSDDAFNASLSGRITTDGVMDLTLTYTFSGCWGDCNKPSRGSKRVSVKLTGIASLDEEGHLIGFLVSEDSEIVPFEWILCE